jgi:hypothetical protein
MALHRMWLAEVYTGAGPGATPLAPPELASTSGPEVWDGLAAVEAGTRTSACDACLARQGCG